MPRVPILNRQVSDTPGRFQPSAQLDPRADDRTQLAQGISESIGELQEGMKEAALFGDKLKSGLVQNQMNEEARRTQMEMRQRRGVHAANSQQEGMQQFYGSDAYKNFEDAVGDMSDKETAINLVLNAQRISGNLNTNLGGHENSETHQAKIAADMNNIATAEKTFASDVDPVGSAQKSIVLFSNLKNHYHENLGLDEKTAYDKAVTDVSKLLSTKINKLSANNPSAARRLLLSIGSETIKAGNSPNSLLLGEKQGGKLATAILERLGNLDTALLKNRADAQDIFEATEGQDEDKALKFLRESSRNPQVRKLGSEMIRRRAADLETERKGRVRRSVNTAWNSLRQDIAQGKARNPFDYFQADTLKDMNQKEQLSFFKNLEAFGEYSSQQRSKTNFYLKKYRYSSKSLQALLTDPVQSARIMNEVGIRGYNVLEAYSKKIMPAKKGKSKTGLKGYTLTIGQKRRRIKNELSLRTPGFGSLTEQEQDAALAPLEIDMQNIEIGYRRKYGEEMDAATYTHVLEFTANRYRNFKVKRHGIGKKTIEWIVGNANNLENLIRNNYVPNLPDIVREPERPPQDPHEIRTPPTARTERGTEVIEGLTVDTPEPRQTPIRRQTKAAKFDINTIASQWRSRGYRAGNFLRFRRQASDADKAKLQQAFQDNNNQIINEILGKYGLR